MTCIIGVIGTKEIVIAGDSAAVDSRYDLQIRSDKKIIEVGPFLMGFATSYRMGQILRYSLRIFEQLDGWDDETFMNSVFIIAVRTCLKDGGWSKVENNVEQGGEFIVGYRGRL